MKQEKIVILDLTGCHYLGEMHQKIKRTFDFPDYYGENWHAFKDAFITVGVPDRIEVIGTDTLPNGLMEDVAHMVSVFENIKRELNAYDIPFDYEVIT